MTEEKSRKKAEKNGGNRKNLSNSRTLKENDETVNDYKPIN